MMDPVYTSTGWTYQDGTEVDVLREVPRWANSASPGSIRRLIDELEAQYRSSIKAEAYVAGMAAGEQSTAA